MSRTTREINRVTGTVINVSLKLILLALVCILMYEGVTRGYSFGHEIFDPTPMESGEGTAKQVTVEDGFLRCILPDGIGEEKHARAQIVLQTVISGLKDIEQVYPNLVRIKYLRPLEVAFDH